MTKAEEARELRKELLRLQEALRLSERHCRNLELQLRQSQKMQVPSPLDRLSSRERQVLQLVVEGHSSASIASIVNLSPKSVDTYRSRVMKKLGVRDLSGLIKFAIQNGLASEN